MNEDALTFNRLTAAEAFPSTGGGFEGLPLKGGIAWMNRFDRLIGASDLTGGFMAAGWAGFGGGGLVAVLIAGTGCWGGVPKVEGEVFACPIARAVSETASDFVFSRICFCFSSSFVKIGTRSSGMGFLSCNFMIDQLDFSPSQKCDVRPTLNDWLNLTKSAVHLSRSALKTACFF